MNPSSPPSTSIIIPPYTTQQSHQLQILVVATTTTTNPSTSSSSSSWEHVKEMIDKQEIGKHFLGVAISMGMSLVFSQTPFSTNNTFHNMMQAGVIALSCGFASIWNGIMLPYYYPKASTLFLISGISFIIFAFMHSFLCSSLNWIPPLCCLASLFPLARFLLAFLPRTTNTNPNSSSY